jgi:proteasome accessory factor B
VVAGPDGDRVELRYSDPDSFAHWLVGYGADVVVLEPDEVRKAIVARLRDMVHTLAPAHAAGAAP